MFLHRARRKTMSQPILLTNNLTKTYGSLFAVNNVSLEIEKGALVGLVGKNGAGKTTLIRLLTGIITPTAGSVQLLTERKPTTVSAIVEKPALYTNFRAIDNLRMQCKLLGIPADETYLKETLKLVSLAPESRLKVKEFSLGMKQRLAIAMAVVGKPEILIMDEPTNGLDPQGIHDIREFLVKLNEEYGTTIIVSSHILTELSKFVKEYVFMNNGKIVARSSPEEVEKLCGKHLRIVVDNVEVAKSVLSQMGEVRPTAINTLEFTGETPSTEVVMALAQANVNVASIVNVGDSLEEFFIKLVGENK